MSESILLQQFEIISLDLEDFGAKGPIDKIVFVDKIKQLISFLILVPDSPDLEQFHLLGKLKEVIFAHQFNSNDKPYYLDLVASLMKYFTIQVKLFANKQNSRPKSRSLTISMM
jgi:hypothetical protein